VSVSIIRSWEEHGQAKQQTDPHDPAIMPGKSEFPKGSVLIVAPGLHGHGQFIGT
jgi:hypothetical protein